jgi:ATP-dependent DNA helicase RecG
MLFSTYTETPITPQDVAAYNVANGYVGSFMAPHESIVNYFGFELVPALSEESPYYAGFNLKGRGETTLNITSDEDAKAAIREALVNAIAHRDYTIVGDTITFYIYSNRIEIISPGRSLVPIEDLGNINPVHRNKALCNIFRYTKYMEHVGTGILRMKESMKNEGLSEPEFHNFTNNFRVTFYGRKNTEQLPLKLTNNDKIINLNELNLKDRQITALKMMLNNNYIFTTKKYIDKFKVSKSTAARDLTELVDKNLISKESDKRPILYLKK